MIYIIGISNLTRLIGFKPPPLLTLNLNVTLNPKPNKRPYNRVFLGLFVLPNFERIKM
jgi:hypothetical protein